MIRSFAEIQDHARAWLRMVEPFRSPELGLLHAKTAHTIGRATPAGLARYHATAMDGGYYVLSLLACGERLDEARLGLRTILGNQDADPASETWGEFRWYLEDTAVSDCNATFFTIRNLLTAYLFYPKSLDQQLIAKMEQAFLLSLRRKFLRHCPRVGWSNAFVGENVLAAILAEMFGEEQGLAAIRNNFERFYQTNFTHGIIERLSPCYYGTTLALASLGTGLVREPRIRRILRELLETQLLEAEFFAHRTPLPATRTYNGSGEGWNFLFLAWPLGLNPMGVPALERRGWLHGGTVHLWHELAAGGLETRHRATLPNPRILEGCFAGESSLYSYYHRDFTLGCFSLYPEPGGEVQDAYDMPAGFSADGSNLGLLGLVFEGADGGQVGAPLRCELGDADAAFKQLRKNADWDFRQVAHQHENVMIWLAGFDQVRTAGRLLGTTLRVPQFTGAAFRQDGTPLEGESGTLDSQWVFLITDSARFGIFPLQRTLAGHPVPTSGEMLWYGHTCDPSRVRPYPGPWHALPDPSTVEVFAVANRRFGLVFPNFQSGEACEIRRRSVVAGAVVVAGGREVTPGRFMENCRGLRIEETWSHDGYLQCREASERIRSVTVADAEFTLRLVYDNQHKRVLERSVNDVAPPRPGACSHLRSAPLPLLHGP